jgi:hypothetical protein
MPHLSPLLMISGSTLLAMLAASCPINTHIQFSTSSINNPDFTITQLALTVTISCRRAIRHSGRSLRRLTPLPPATIPTSPCNDDYVTSFEAAPSHVGTSSSAFNGENVFPSIEHATATWTPRKGLRERGGWRPVSFEFLVYESR